MATIYDTPVQPAVGYFVDQKKGEVNELKQLLKNINVEKDMKRKREIIKKVIAYMTLGIDVSRLFTDMIMAIETKDIVIKKMVYLYLCNYAIQQPEMAIMCINSLRRDCDNEDPLVRGLALRSLCGLRLESILEYIELPLKKSLTDLSAYVRKTGVMAILKVNTISPALIENSNYVAELYRMLDDPDATVVTNALYVINELLLSQGGIEITQARIMTLLNRIGEFSEWGLNMILDLVSRYNPSSEEEIFGVMNLLDPVLRTANSSAVLATVKCFIKLTNNMPDLQPQVYMRTKPPVLTLVTGSHAEGQFAMLKHLELILHQPAAKGVFDDEFRQLFVRYNEPAHVKHLKVDLLPLVANESNAREIASELGEYVTDVDPELSKRAIRALGEIGIRLVAVSVEMTQNLMELINTDVSYVRSEAAIVLSNLVRINPKISPLILPYLAKSLKRVEDPEAKAALVWMLGEFGDQIPEAPYVLEPMVDNYEDETAISIKLQLLTAAMKLFFKRPPEMQAMLGRLLRLASNDTTSQDLHDRSLLYYRLLVADVTVAQALFQEGKAFDINGQFMEKKDFETKKKLFAEFNTLAVVHGIPSELFVAENYQLKLENLPARDFEFATPAPSYSTPATDVAAATPTTITHAPSVSSQVVGSVNLLDWDEEIPSIQPAVSPMASSTAIKSVTLSDQIDITPVKFQELWTSLPDAISGPICTLSQAPVTVAELEPLLLNSKIFTIASGALPSAIPGGHQGYKMFVYGVEAGNPLIGSNNTNYLVQIIIDGSSLSVTVTIKTDSTMAESSAKKFVTNLVASLSSYSPHSLCFD